MASTEDLSRFERDGYSFLGKVLDAEFTTRVEDLVAEIIARPIKSYGGIRVEFVDGQWSSVQIRQPGAVFPKLREAYVDEILLAAARQAIGQNARSVNSEELIIRAPRVGRASPWHQDEAFMPPGRTYKRATIWIAICNAYPSIGSPMFIRGSSQGPILRHIMEPLPRISEDLPALPVDTISLKSGEATIHGCRTIHQVSANRSDQLRVAYVHRYEVPD